MATKAQIIKRALVRAGVVAYDQIPTAAQESQADTALMSMHESWVDQGFARWELTDIPQQVENGLVAALAFAIADDFGVPTERYQRLSVGNSAAMREIYAYNEVPYSGSTQSTYY